LINTGGKMKYQYITENTLAKIDDDGKSRLSCSIDNEDFIAWVAEGNTPDPISEPTAEELKAKTNAGIYAKLELIDKQSIRGIREWIALQPTAEKFTKDLEAEATAEREKMQK
jgi:hypothetical protein